MERLNDGIFFFSSTHCRNCKPAKDWLIQNKIRFETYDVENGGGDLANRLGVRSLPTVVVIKGASVKQFLPGFSPTKYQEIFAR